MGIASENMVQYVDESHRVKSGLQQQKCTKFRFHNVNNSASVEDRAMQFACGMRSSAMAD